MEAEKTEAAGETIDIDTQDAVNLRTADLTVNKGDGGAGDDVVNVHNGAVSNNNLEGNDGDEKIDVEGVVKLLALV